MHARPYEKRVTGMQPQAENHSFDNQSRSN
jgi:hypothetical protein